MKAWQLKPARWGLYFLAIVWFLLVVPFSVAAAPYAAMVMDARSGEVLHSRNADTRLHPASLTKMMTLYIVFEAVRNGEIGLDDMVRVSRAAAAEPPSKLGLRPGQQIKLRYLIRASAVKSANDAATALAEAIEGSEAAFARRMNRTAKALGMTRTTFRNAHGLTESGHLSTARDMTILGRQLLYDYPEYYNLFSRRSADAGIKTVPNTNRRLLDAYAGADGIKTGYTRAAGFNLVASAKRGNERVIATVFGGRSSATRNQRVAELLDMGFGRAPTHVAVNRPPRPAYQGGKSIGQVTRVSGAVTRSLRPQARPGAGTPTIPVAVAVAESVAEQIATSGDTAIAEGSSGGETDGLAPVSSLTPAMRPAEIMQARLETPESTSGPEVVTRLSTSGERHWGINVGRYPSRYSAEKVLLKTALSEMSTLDGSLRKVVRRSGGFDANFMGLTREVADLACRKLQARNVTCFMIGPS
ncbi:MAG: D-alanyl-D-alanine carboxypeptidase family protein [Paracoccaceae bacterium]